MTEINFKQTRHEAISDLLVTAAERFMTRAGFDSVTMREIATEAGCSPATLYQYFKNKEDLLGEIVARHSQRCIELLDAALSETTDPLESLRKTLKCRLEYTYKHRHVARLFFTNVPRSTTDPLHYLPKRLHAKWQAVKDREVSNIKMAQHLGKLRRDIDAEMLHVFMHRVVSSMLEHWSTSEPLLNEESLFNLTWGLLSSGMGSKA